MRPLSLIERAAAVCAYSACVLCGLLCVLTLCACAAVAIFQPILWPILIPGMLCIAWVFGALTVCAFNAGDDYVRG